MEVSISISRLSCGARSTESCCFQQGGTCAQADAAADAPVTFRADAAQLSVPALRPCLRTRRGATSLQRQRTLAAQVELRGIGLHSGAPVGLTLKPAPANSGIVFRRIDHRHAQDIPARAVWVGDTSLSSTLLRQGLRVATVEHLMAALAGLGVDNLLVEVDGPEVPVMDGSARPFAEAMLAAGLVQQPAVRRFIRILRPVTVSEGDRRAALFPDDTGFHIDFSIEFDHPVLRASGDRVSLSLDPSVFLESLCAARTFGFLRDIEQLRARGLALGGGLHNAVVVDDQRVLNPEGLRYPDEFVRHKALDAIGDLYLLGNPLLGALRASKSGHALNNRLARAVLEQPDAWEFAALDESSGRVVACTPDRTTAA